MWALMGAKCSERSEDKEERQFLFCREKKVKGVASLGVGRLVDAENETRSDGKRTAENNSSKGESSNSSNPPLLLGHLQFSAPKHPRSFGE